MMTILENDQVSEMDVDHQGESLEYLISIWPISTKIATHLPAGDLISLSRSSRALRSHTHGFGYDSHHLSEGSHSTYTPDLHLGEHQTQYWANLKALSPFVCSFPSHREPKSAKNNPCRACKFCSRPICKTCIVRSFFTDPKSSKLTYKYRARHLCPKCWDTGNLRKDFRYSADCVSREQIWRGRAYAQRGNWCGCSASEDNWVCGECRVLQNMSGVSNDAVSLVPIDDGKITHESTVPAGESVAVKCYGLDCDVTINEIDRDRRRICLWCSKPLMRPYGGDDRLRWEEKQIEIRAAAAASRSADIYEWARNRFKSLTMSRREMRGTEACIELTGSDGPEHDQPIFVRHLDTINYRQHMNHVNQESVPSGDNVYQSKQGRWIYSIAFLIRFDAAIKRSSYSRAFALPPNLDLEELFIQNADMGLPGARTNSHPHFHGNNWSTCKTILRYGTQLQNAGLADRECLSWLHLTQPRKSWTAMENFRNRLFHHLEIRGSLSEEQQLQWKPPSFWYLADQAGLLEKKKDEKEDKKITDGEHSQNDNDNNNDDEDVDDDDKNIEMDGNNTTGNDSKPVNDDEADVEDSGNTYQRPRPRDERDASNMKKDPLSIYALPPQGPTGTPEPPAWHMDVPMDNNDDDDNQGQWDTDEDSDHDDNDEMMADDHGDLAN